MISNSTRVREVYRTLHQMPEVGLEEVKTSAYLARQLKDAGYSVKDGVGGTGVVGVITGKQSGPVLALRADMDALHHIVAGKHCAIHSCGHDAHSAMVLAVAEAAAQQGISCGTLKIIFQPAEETLSGALRLIEAGAIEDVDIILGIHLRPGQEAKRGQATPALYHGAGYIMEASLEGVTAHGARPHLGINAIDAAAAVVNAVNAIKFNPVVPSSVKVTKLWAGGAALNAIPDKAEMAFDLRSQDTVLIDELIEKVTRAIEAGAATVGAKASVVVQGGVPAAQYSQEIIDMAKDAISDVLGDEGVLLPITTPGGEDFHFYARHKPAIKAGYIGLGCDLSPGLHHPDMKFAEDALVDGVNILLHMVDRVLGFHEVL